jgi:hypothetical protein
VEKGFIEISFKKMIKYKVFKQQEGDMWMVVHEYKDDKVLVYPSNKDVLKNINKSFFEGVVPDAYVKN